MQTNGSGISSFDDMMHLIIDLHTKLVVQMFCVWAETIL